jgi:glycosyl transferase family 87
LLFPLPKSLTPKTSKRVCALVALAYLAIATAVGFVRTPIYGDFSQFYLTGLIDRAGAYDALYPIPILGSVHNAGAMADSSAKPQLTAIAAAHGVNFTPYHFILPPPAALLFWPLGFLSGPAAFTVWMTLSVLAGWGVAMIAASIFERCANATTYAAGLVMLLVACTPPMPRAILTGNLTPLVALAIGWVVLCLMNDRHQPSAAWALIFGLLTKYATVVLLPIPLAQRRWRMLISCAAATIAWTAIALYVMGPAPFQEFFHTIAPTLARSHESSDNISLAGILLHLLHRMPPLPSVTTHLLQLAQLLVLALVLIPIARLRQRLTDPATIAPAALALLTWLLIFSPVSWSHYLTYLCPLWGWLIWQATKSKPRFAIATIAIAVQVLTPPQIPVPATDAAGLRLLLSTTLMLTLAIQDLWQQSQPRRAAQSTPRELTIIRAAA